VLPFFCGSSVLRCNILTPVGIFIFASVPKLDAAA
jgi:hypothetical protein